MRLKLTTQLHLGFTVAVLLALVITGMAWWITLNYEHDVEVEHQQVLASTIALAEAESVLWQLRYGFPQFVVGDAAERRRILAEEPRWYEIIEARLETYARHVTTEQERQALAELRAEYQRYKEARPKFFELYQTGRIEDAARWRALTTTPYGIATVKALGRQIALERTHAEEKARDETEALRTIRTVLALLTGVLLLFLALGYVFALRALRPIRALQIQAQQVMRKQLGEELEVFNRGNEIATLVESVQRMSDRFTAYAAEIARADAALRHEHEVLDATVAERTAALKAANRELDERNRRNQLLTEMIGLLQSVRDLDEAARVLPQFLEPLFAPNTGAVYIIKSSLNYLDVLARWGEMPLVPTFEITDCWGLRRGQPYLVEQTDGALACPHASANTLAGATLCVPMMAEGATLGLLYLAYAQLAPDAATAQVWRAHTQRVCEQLGLALANLKLRKQLREQSVHDIQTGLYNRRFLEESLPRELARAERENYPVAVLMLDVDHFKKFNDSYGHEAGDAVLRALGHVLTESVRASDLAYRFGGEEFIVALPRMLLEQAREWADRFMQRVRRMEVKAGGLSLPGVTVSMGLAFAPEHGTDPETVIQAADLALYEAKRGGRDRLVVYAATAPDKAAN